MQGVPISCNTGDQAQSRKQACALSVLPICPIPRRINVISNVVYAIVRAEESWLGVKGLTEQTCGTDFGAQTPTLNLTLAACPAAPALTGSDPKTGASWGLQPQHWLWGSETGES